METVSWDSGFHYERRVVPESAPALVPGVLQKGPPLAVEWPPDGRHAPNRSPSLSTLFPLRAAVSSCSSPPSPCLPIPRRAPPAKIVMGSRKGKAPAVGGSSGSSARSAITYALPTTEDREAKDSLRKSARTAARAEGGASGASAAGAVPSSNTVASVNEARATEPQTLDPSLVAPAASALGGTRPRALKIRKPPALPVVKTGGKSNSHTVPSRGKGKGPTTGSFSTMMAAAAAAEAAAASVSAAAGQTAAPYLPEAPVNLVVSIDGVPQELSPVEYELNTQQELMLAENVAAGTRAGPSRSVGARRKAGASHKAPVLSITKPGGKAAARVTSGRDKAPATYSLPPSSASALTAGTAADEATEAVASVAAPPPTRAAAAHAAGPTASARPAPTRAVPAGELSTVMLSTFNEGVKPLVLAVGKLQEDLDSLRKVVDTHGGSLAAARQDTAAVRDQLSTGLSAILDKGEKTPVPDVKNEEVDLAGFQMIERVRARLRKTLFDKLGFSNTSIDAIPDKDTFRDLIALDTQEELNLDEAAAQAWLTTPVATPSRGGGGTPLLVRPFVPLLRVRGHFLQAVKKRVIGAYFSAIDLALAAVTPVVANQWKADDKYMVSAIGRKAIVAGASAVLVAVGAGSRIVQPTEVGDEVVVETTVAVVSLVATFVRAALDEAANVIATNTVGDNLLEKVAAEQARFEEHWIMDAEIHHGIRLVDGLAEE